MTHSNSDWHFDNSFARLPSSLFVKQLPVNVRHPQLVQLNVRLAGELGLDVAMLTNRGAAFFSGNEIPPGAMPLAQAYAGHQFGHFTMLGDGRAILLGELIDRQGQRRDLQLKGSGKTPFSRGGDGRAPLGPVLREYIISEAMVALGVPTTLSLAVTTTGEDVVREQILPGAVLTRVAASHIRVGTFEYLAARGDTTALQALVDYVLARHYPADRSALQPAQTLLTTVIARQAALIARWMQIGFIHGVMNTDNMSIAGETIDYGPCAFMDAYDPATRFSSIDRTGRYAYNRQPHIAFWNLNRFAETLLPLLHADATSAVAVARECLATFEDTYRHHWLSAMGSKLGLFTPTSPDDDLIAAWLQLLQRQGADFCNSHRALIALVETDPGPLESELFAQHSETDPDGQQASQAWQKRWQARLSHQGRAASEVVALMQDANPVVIPRNHRVEQAISAAVEAQDYAPMQKLLAILERPFEAQADAAEYRRPPRPEERVLQTFCGT